MTVSWKHGAATFLSLAACVSALGLGACKGDVTPSDGDTETDGDPNTPGGPGEKFDIESLDVAQTEAYLAKIAAPLVGRVLSAEERARIKTDAGKAIVPIIEGWAKDPGLVHAARMLVEEKIAVSGESDGIDYTLPGNLVEHVVKHDRPWAEILTSDTCYDAADAPIECDTGAPFTAGLLTTRGYMRSRYGHFNLSRAGVMMRAFACQVQPIPPTLEPGAAPEVLKSMFAIQNLATADPEVTKVAVNLGCACFSCHSIFAVHSQPFIKFDDEGLYFADATGEQDPVGELGNSLDGTAASHFKDPVAMASEASTMLGQPVQNLAEAAKVLTEHPVFVECAAQNVIEHVLRIEQGPLGKNIASELLEEVAEKATTVSPDPTFQAVVVAAFTHPSVVKGTLESITGEGQ